MLHSCEAPREDQLALVRAEEAIGELKRVRRGGRGVLGHVRQRIVNEAEVHVVELQQLQAVVYRRCRVGVGFSIQRVKRDGGEAVCPRVLGRVEGHLCRDKEVLSLYVPRSDRTRQRMPHGILIVVEQRSVKVTVTNAYRVPYRIDQVV